MEIWTRQNPDGSETAMSEDVAFEEILARTDDPAAAVWVIAALLQADVQLDGWTRDALERLRVRLLRRLEEV